MFELFVIEQYKNIECCTTMFCGEITTYVAGNHDPYLGLHVECPKFLSDFNQILTYSTDFHKSPQNKVSRKFTHWQPP
jgi:hypothetical protein